VADTTRDIADDGFHEIQLSGKQLVFLFMATTVVSVLIFLCGVMVGRDVHTERPTEATDAALTTPAPAPAPAPVQQAQTSAPTPEKAATQAATPAEPPSPPADDELTYRKRLESEGTPAEKLKPQGTTARTDPKPEPPSRPEPAASTRPAPETAAARTAPDAPPATAGGRPGRWVVQLVALRDRGAASSIVQRLSGKGYPAFMVNPSSSTPNQVFKVQVGRYDDRGEAERVSRRLEKEEKFSPWISR
jgi:cell division septation protein DedD